MASVALPVVVVICALAVSSQTLLNHSQCCFYCPDDDLLYVIGELFLVVELEGRLESCFLGLLAYLLSEDEPSHRLPALAVRLSWPCRHALRQWLRSASPLPPTASVSA